MKSIHNRVTNLNRRVRTHVSARLAALIAMNTPEEEIKGGRNRFRGSHLVPDTNGTVEL
ncbi:hypothetical protein Pan110_04470 [Gimesia panareensis]|nr:hypothetical protein Pan110_04470 [Gimesia panareensis]